MRHAGTSKRANGRGHGLSIGLATMSCAVALAACGTGGSSTAGTGGSSNARAGGGPLLKLAQCMRSHGVPGFPDPRPNGGGLIIGSNINPQSPAFISAQKACTKLGLGGPGSRSAGAGSPDLRLLTLARCMRRHGVPNFPDPTHSPPPLGNGNVIGEGGLYLALGPPASSQAPAFKRAAAACGFRLP
jgi:hypothetical protein